MKIGVSKLPVAASTTQSVKNFRTLIELIKPLGSTSALIKTSTLGEITISLKTLLKENTLYEALILKDGKDFHLKVATSLPQEVKKVLQAKALISIEKLISELSLGKSPKKIAVDALFQLLTQTKNSDEVKDLLSHLLVLLQKEVTLIPLTIQDKKGYVNFKKRDKDTEKTKLTFEAYFSHLGFLSGYILLHKKVKSLHLQISSEEIKELLHSHKKSLNMPLIITLKEEKNVTLQNSLLDIKA